MTRDLSQDELRAALAAADRGMRLPWAMIIGFGALTGLMVSLVLRVVNFDDHTHVLIIAAAGFLYAQMSFLAAVIASRQNAANARMLRALELLDERLSPR